jgi:predicted RNA-binding Zn-ribbon protein involved in translation (DUF1610 family)
MKKEHHEDYDLVAKHCPDCQALVMARRINVAGSRVRYAGYRCSECSWRSPSYKQQKRAG